MFHRVTAACVALLCAAVPALAAPSIESHEITLTLDPAGSRLTAEDRVVVRRDGGGTLRFTLNRGLPVEGATLDGAAVTAPIADDDGWTVGRSVEVPPGPGATAVLVVRYGGSVVDPDARGDLRFPGRPTRGLVVPDDAYLTPASRWYPDDGTPARFTLRATPVPDFEIVTQGTRTAPAAAGGPTVWRVETPADGLTLVAGRWRASHRRVGGVEVGAYLLPEDAGLADAVLDAAAARLRACEAAYGPCPGARFDVLERSSGDGHPLPGAVFVSGETLRSAAAVKARAAVADDLLRGALCCWWGDGVLVDRSRGDWSGAFVAWCVDDLTTDPSGPAAARRADVALGIAHMPADLRDLPLRAALDGGTRAPGTGLAAAQGALFLHGLRREVGDDAFRATLRRVAAERRGARITWDDWLREFETSAKRSLGDLFAQGLDRGGAPVLEITGAQVRSDGGVVRVAGVLRQVLADGEKPWRLAVPIVVEHVLGREESLVDLVSAETAFSVAVPSLPLRVTVDPDHHVFRVPAPDELAPCCAATTARPHVTVVFPDGDAALESVASTLAGRDATVVAASAAPKTLEKGTSWVLVGDETRMPLLAALRTKLPRHFLPPGADPKTTAVLATSRSPVDPSEWVTTFVGAADVLDAARLAPLAHRFDTRVVLVGGAATGRSTATPPSRTTRFLLPDLKSATSPERAQRVVEKLTSPEMKGRLAGSPEESRARRFVADELRLAGIEPDEVPFTFAVKRYAPERTSLARVGAAAGAPDAKVAVVPLVASPETPEGGLSIVGAVDGDGADLAGRAFVLDLGKGTKSPLEFVRAAARVAAGRGAAALLVRMPKDPPPAVAELWEFPERLHPDVAAALAEAQARGEGGDPALRAARTAARTGSDVELPLPTVAVPADFHAVTGEILRLDVHFGRTEVTSANLVGRVRARSGGAHGGSVVLFAHLDGLGDGFPGADGASGVAALLEAANALSVHADLLAEDVTVVVLGAEEWGLRGSRAFTASLADGAADAAIGVDAAGRRGVDAVTVVGAADERRLGRTAVAALGQTALDAGSDPAPAAFVGPDGGGVFRGRGIPAVTLWSGDYVVTRTRADTADGIDASKTARVGRALALAALAAAGGR